MRYILVSMTMCLLTFSLIIGFGHIITNSRGISVSNQVLQAYALNTAVSDPVEYAFVKQRLVDRVLFYDQMIERRFLDKGMVINRSIDGKAIDHCDSLLFSSLRFVALHKLGLQESASEAWAAIEKSQDDRGKWNRHPDCKHWTSRDMIVGLLTALSQLPPNADEHLHDLVNYVNRSGGYIGDGPFYVSFLSPGLRDSLRALSANSEVQDSGSLRDTLAMAFSTLEFDIYLADRGYQSHLNGLVMWLELELLQQTGGSKLVRSRNLPANMEHLFAKFTRDRLGKQRLAWLTKRLVNRDPHNMFFRWLRLRSADALTDGVRLKLMKELLSMQQFPSARMPGNCDRKADYLWQRSSDEHEIKELVCTKYFNAVDFLWMAALLLEGTDGRTASATSY